MEEKNKKEVKVINIDNFIGTYLKDAEIFGEDSVHDIKRKGVDAYTDFINEKRKVIQNLKKNCYGTYPQFYKIIEEKLEDLINTCMDRAFLIGIKKKICIKK